MSMARSTPAQNERGAANTTVRGVSMGFEPRSAGQSTYADSAKPDKLLGRCDRNGQETAGTKTDERGTTGGDSHAVRDPRGRTRTTTTEPQYGGGPEPDHHHQDGSADAGDHLAVAAAQAALGAGRRR